MLGLRGCAGWGTIAAALVAFAAPVQGQPATNISLDGPGHSVVPVNGVNNIFTITPGMGHIMGPNLFQSLHNFDVGTGDTAAFQSGGAANIIARVTGGTASNIDGTLTSDANLFLVNPAGVVFGTGAQVNVSGAFVVSTANDVKFSDGGIFHAQLDANDQLSSAPVSAFGFLGPPAPISFAAGSQVHATATQSLTSGIHVIGGNLSFDQSTLIAPGGNLTLFSAASAGEVPFNLAAPGTDFMSATNTSFGTITAQHFSHLGIDGGGGGSVYIRGGRMVMDNSRVTALDTGSVAGGNISVRLQSLTMMNSTAATNTTTDTNSSQISAIAALGSTTGSAGNVDVEAADSIDMHDGAMISSNTYGKSNAGNVIVDTPTLTLDGGYYLPGGYVVRRTQVESITSSYYAAQLFSTVSTYGNSGSVNVVSDNISVTHGAQISTNTDDDGNAGVLNVTAHQALVVSGPILSLPNDLLNSEVDESEIGTSTYQAGAAGTVTVNAGTIELSDTGQINASSLSQVINHQVSPITGAGGIVTVNANDMIIEGAETKEAPVGDESIVQNIVSGVYSVTATDGPAGIINLNIADTLSLWNGGQITASSKSNSQKAGDINIHTKNLTLDGIYTNPYIEANLGKSSSVGRAITGIFASANGSSNSHADAGTITITATGAVTVSDGAKISVKSTQLQGGDIVISAPQLTLLSGGNIDTSASKSGGTITLNIGQLIYLSSAVISSEARGGQGSTGGNIVIDPQLLALNSSSISANDLGGTGGDITIVADDYLTNASSITASGQKNGVINISSPVLDLSGSLNPLTAVLVNDGDRLRESCASSIKHEYSSLTEVGRGGTETAPDELHPDFNIDIR